MSRGSYILGFLHPGVLMFRVFLCPGVILFRGSNPFPGVLTYITLSLSLRGSDILGFLHPGVFTFRDSYVQGLFCPVTIMSRAYYIQGF